MGETRDLADFVWRTRFADIPPRTVDRIKVYTLDNLAAGFVGSTKPWTQAVGAMLDDLGGTPQATCFNRPRQTDISRAALLNGVAMDFTIRALTARSARRRRLANCWGSTRRTWRGHWASPDRAPPASSSSSGKAL